MHGSIHKRFCSSQKLLWLICWSFILKKFKFEIRDTPLTAKKAARDNMSEHAPFWTNTNKVKIQDVSKNNHNLELI